jgi:juvenile hormone epoxide hydrolase
MPKTGPDTKVYRMILLHGWPGSIREFYEILPLLTTPSKDNIVFEVIAPSLPGYGWSDAAAKQGLNTVKIAVIMKNLMSRLGFEKFYVQGEKRENLFTMMRR